MANKNINYGREITIRKILDSDCLPLVAKIREISSHTSHNLHGFKEVLFHKQLKSKYAQFQILKSEDGRNEAEILDKQFLIPIKYHGKLKFVHRPGSLKRYTSIKQVLGEMPRYLITEEETVAVPANGIGKNIILPAKSSLEITRRYIDNNTTFIECTEKSLSVTFRESDRVHFTAVEDGQLYEIQDLLRYQLLPAAVQFRDMASEDFILEDENLNKKLLATLSGPLELLGFVDIELVIVWIRDTINKTYKTVLIPSQLWDSFRVQKRRFEDKEHSSSYIKRLYGHCVDADFVLKGLYTIPADGRHIVWLRSPNLCKRSSTDPSIPEFTYLDYEESSSDDEDEDLSTDDYLTPVASSPPVPPRVPITKPESILLPTRQEKKHFRKKLADLVKWHKSSKGVSKYMKSKSSGSSFKINEKQKQLSYRLSKSLSDVSNIDSSGDENSDTAISRGISRPTPDATNRNRQSFPGSDIHGTMFDTLADSCTLHANTNAGLSALPADIERLSERPSEVPPDKDRLRAGSLEAPSDKRASNSLPARISCSQLSPQIPAIPDRNSSSTPNASASSNEYVCMVPLEPPRRHERQRKTSEPARYKAKAVCTPHTRLSTQKQTYIPYTKPTHDTNFFDYTVSQVAGCFSDCGLTQLGEICSKNKLDGKFFKNFDFNRLREEPFHMTSFELLKVQKIVIEGWRPNLDN